MDRVNRRFIFSSTVIAVPMVLLMASLSTGDTPDIDLGAVQHAVPQLTRDKAVQSSSAVQQVAGKQLESRKARPGLLEVLAGSPKGNTNHRHKNMGDIKSRGLLDGVFGSSKEPIRNNNQDSPHNRSNQQSTKSQANVDWNGIPYHSPAKSNGQAGRVPVQDPTARTVTNRSVARQAPSGQSRTRIIHGGSSRVTNATPVSARSNSTAPSAQRDTAAATLPKPPADIIQAPVQAPRFSSTTSSRRSGRRDLTALEATVERKPMPEAKVSSPTSTGGEVSLVPRVKAKPVPQPKPVVNKAQVAETSADQVAETSDDQVAETSDDQIADDDTTEEPNTALAAIGSPTAMPESLSAADAASDDDSGSSESGSYTVPVDPATSPVPTAGIPKHPYAASTPQSALSQGSTPASPAAHRAGPPASAFINSAPLPSSRNANSPIGSGVVPNDDVAAKNQASEPIYQTARLPGSSNDPYGSHSPSSRLSTNGQPIESAAATNRFDVNAIQKENMARWNASAGGVPMHTIPGHHPMPDSDSSSGNQHSSDNFDRSTYQTRNQMRGAASEPGIAGRGLGELATTSELPGIRVTTHGPSSIMIRQTSQFEIRVENRGSIDANGVLIRSLVPDWADLGGQNASVGDVDVREQGSGRQLVWTIDHLPAGTSERMFVRLTAARSGSYDLDVDWTLLPQKAIAKVQVREPKLDLTIEGPEEVVYGQSQTYKVHVLNPGDGTAPNVVFTLSPNSATPQTQRIGDIPPGKEAQFDVELTAQDLGDLKIHGLAMGELDLRAEASKTIRVSAAQLEAMLNGPELKYQDSDATYNLQVQNTGSVASEKIMATLRIPTGVEYVGGIEAVKLQGNMLRWEITSLPPGGTRNYQFRCKMTSTGEHMFSFDCKGTAAGNTDVSLSTQVESIADLVLSVNDPTAPAPIGSDVTYEIVIRNRGSKEATDVRAVAQFSHGIEPKRIEGQSGEVVTGQVLFDPIARIGAGQEVRLRVIAQADRGGHHRFRSEVRSGDTVLVAEEATHYMNPKSERVSRHSRDNVNR